MATKYVSKDAWHFQYVLNDVQPFYAAMSAQGVTVSDTPIEEEDSPGTVKTVFPGSSPTATTPIY